MLPAGKVTRVLVVPEKVTVKIGDAENWWRDAGIKIDCKWQTFLFV